MCAYNGFVLLVNNDVLVENTKWRARSALLLLWSLGILRIHCRNLHTHTHKHTYTYVWNLEMWAPLFVANFSWIHKSI